MNIVSKFAEQVKQHADFDRVIGPDGKPWTLHSIYSKSVHLARGLANLGLQPNDRIAVLMPCVPQVHVAFPAIWRLGGVLFPIHYASSPMEIASIVKSFEIKCVITTFEKVRAVANEVKDLPVERWIVSGGQGEMKFSDFEALCSVEGPELPICPREKSDPAVVILTSGTTGKPKGIAQSHGNFWSYLEVLKKTPDRDGAMSLYRREGGVQLFFSSYGHTTGPSSIIAGYDTKFSTVLVAQFDLLTVLKRIQEYKVTYFMGSPTVFTSICEYPGLKSYDISSVISWNSATAPITEESLQKYERVLGRRIYQWYSLTESFGGVTVDVDSVPRRPGAVGRPVYGCELKIVDDEGRELPQGSIGEICIRRGTNVLGYLNSPEENQKTFRDGWVFTKDLGSIDRDGFLFVAGRKSLMINQGGYKIYPSEIERAIEALEEVERCVVVGVPDALFGSVVAAAIKVRAGQTLNEEAVLKHCAKALSENKLPRRIRFVESFPMNKMLKVDVIALQKSFTDEMGAEAAPAAKAEGGRPQKTLSQSEIRKIVVETVSRLLGVADGSLEHDRSLMEAGMNSLKAVLFSKELSNHLGQLVPSTLIFNYPTVDDIVGQLAGDTTDDTTDDAGLADIATTPSAPEEPLAIVGMSCRVPKSDTPESFWRALENEVPTLSEVPTDRWDPKEYYDPAPMTPGKSVTRHGSFLERLDLFDPEFFGISALDAKTLDPHHRMMFELAWEALEDAGWTLNSLRRQPIGVFVGLANAADFILLRQSKGSHGALMGSQAAMLAGRISYFLGLTGPSLVIDTTCSSSLVAFHLACQAVRSGECSAAIAGGVHLLISSLPFTSMSELGTLAPDGRCKTFDAGADGFGRGEGGGAVVIKRLSDAERAGDKILAIVRGTATNQDGRSGSMSAPNGLAQEAVVRQALARSQVRPEEISYVETHGTGTQLGDPIELHALANVFARRTADHPLFLGAVKTNVGHLSAASGIIGVIKTVQVLRHGVIPANLNFRSLNPNIRIDTDRFVIASKKTKWPERYKRRLAGVSSFGLTGTNAHAVLENYPKSQTSHRPSSTGGFVLLLSARTEASLRTLAKKYAVYIQSRNVTAPELADICFFAAKNRSRFQERVAVSGFSPAEVVAGLERVARGEFQSPAIARARAPRKEPKVAFLFAGHGSQYGGMARELYLSNETFRKQLDDCETIVKKILGRGFLSIIQDPAPAESSFNDPVFSQATLCSVQYSLASLWLSLGVFPTILMGHSMGEYVAACVAGVFTPHDMIELVVKRMQLILSVGVAGDTAAISLSSEAVLGLIKEAAIAVEIAAHNGPVSTVVSGRREEVQKFVRLVTDRGGKAKVLAMGWAAHSVLVEPILNEFEAFARKITYHAPKMGLISNLTGQRIGPGMMSSTYWRDHLRHSVRFAEGMNALLAEGCSHIIEAGPGTVALGLAKNLVKDESQLFWFSTMRKNKGEAELVSESLCGLIATGVEPNWDELYPGPSAPVPLDMPTYAFDRQRYWFDSTDESPARSTSNDTKADEVKNRIEALRIRPEAERRAMVASIVAEKLKLVLGSKAPGIENGDRDLAEDGLDSLAAIHLRNEIKRTFGDRFDIPIAAFSQNMTFHALLDRICQFFQTETPSVVAGRAPAKNKWIYKKRPQPNAQMRLFCFHFAGGSAQAFDRWALQMPESIELCAVQLPGRRERIKEPLLVKMDEMVDGALGALRGELDKPYAVLGYSFGAVVAYNWVRAIESQGLPLPIHFFASACRAPGSSPDSAVHDLVAEKSNSRFIELMQAKYGGIPPELLAQKELQDLFAPVMRADLMALLSTQPRIGAPFKFPITLSQGSGDSSVGASSAKAWKAQTSSTFVHKVYEGGHFFMLGSSGEEYRANVMSALLEYLNQSVLRKAGGSDR